MTIFSILDTPAWGGAEEYLSSHLIYCLKKGNRVILATNNQKVKAYLSKKIKSNKLTIISFPFRLDMIGNWKGLIKFIFTAPLAILWLIKLIQANKQKKLLFLLPGFSERLLFTPIIKLYKLPLVWLEYGPLLPTFKRNFTLPKYCYRLVRNLPDRVITISEYSKQSIVKDGLVDREKVIIVYPGVKLLKAKQLASLNKKASNFRKRKKWQDKKIIISVARLAKEKSIDVLIKAFNQLKNKQDYLCIIVGEGPQKTKLESLAAKLGIKNIIFTGFISQSKKELFLAMADVFIFTAAWALEGFGMTTIEAMAFKTLVLTTGFGPQEEIIDQAKTGWKFKAKDAQDLAAKIDLAIKTKSKKVITTKAYQKLKEKFNLKKNQAKFYQILERVYARVARS